MEIHGDSSATKRKIVCIQAVASFMSLRRSRCFAAGIKEVKRLLDYLHSASLEANPELARLALKIATGAGKTTVMAMIIARQTVNAGSKNVTRGFLVVAAGLTIKDRLRVLQPNDPDSYHRERELVPPDMLEDIARAKTVGRKRQLSSRSR